MQKDSYKAHFILGVMAEIANMFSICPKLAINAELYGLVLASRLKKNRIPWNLGSQSATPGPSVVAFISNLGPQEQAKKCLNFSPRFFSPYS
jgi:hypothetical protein